MHRDIARPMDILHRNILVLGALLVLASTAVGQEPVALPKPQTTGGMPLQEALAKRRSVREFKPTPLTAAEVGQLCWAAQGITEPNRGLRTAPTAMLLYSVSVYMVDANGIHAYLPKEHALKTLRSENILAELCALPPNPPGLGQAPAVMVLGLNVGPLAQRVGEKAERYGMMEVGHVAQNVLLQVTALGLGSIPVGGFDDAKVATLLKLPDGVRPVYLLPVGHPK